LFIAVPLLVGVDLRFLASFDLFLLRPNYAGFLRAAHHEIS